MTRHAPRGPRAKVRAVLTCLIMAGLGSATISSAAAANLDDGAPIVNTQNGAVRGTACLAARPSAACRMPLPRRETSAGGPRGPQLRGATSATRVSSHPAARSRRLPSSLLGRLPRTAYTSTCTRRRRGIVSEHHVRCWCGSTAAASSSRAAGTTTRLGWPPKAQWSSR